MSLVVPQKSFVVPKSAVPSGERWKVPGVGKNLVGWITDAPTPPSVPKPVGYRIIVQVFEVKDQTDSGIILAHTTRDGEKILATMGRVIAVGPDAYSDAEKFPSGAWARVGDTVLFATHTGQKISISGVHARIMNDDEIIAVVDEPNAISRG